MRKKILYLYLMGGALAMAALTSCGENGNQKLSDIPDRTTYLRADTIVVEAGRIGDFERVLFLADSLREIGELSDLRAENYQGIAYASMGQVQNAIECFTRATASNAPFNEDFWEYINAGSNLAHLQNAQHNLDGSIRTACYFIERLRQVESPARARELHNLYFCLGNTQTKLQRYDEAAKSFDESYQWLCICLDNDTVGIELKGALTTLANIAIAQMNSEQYAEASKWLDREDSLLAIYKTCSVSDSADVDFYRALTILNRARISQGLGQVAKAAHYYDEYTASDYGKTVEGRISSCAYLMLAHRYKEAAYNYTFLNDFMTGRAIEYDLETIADDLMPKFRSNYYAGHKDSALQVAVQIAEVYDSAFVRQKRSDAAELATIYDTQGKERQIAEQEARNRIFAVVNIAIAIVGVLIIVFAVYVFRQWRATRKKNRILARQISEAAEYKKKYKELKTVSIVAESKDEQTAETIAATMPKAVTVADFTTLTDEQLFHCLRDLIESEHMFLQSDFGRQTLIDRTGLSKERIGAAFSQGSESTSLPAFVRELRLDYAIRMMNDQPANSVEQVSQASGFTSADTFTRNFRAKYGMTPTAYKQTRNDV